MRLIIAITIGLLLSVSAYAASDEANEPEAKVDTLKKTDTLLYVEEGELATTAFVTDSINYETRLRQNPTTALFKSMVGPGWGQWGNGRKVKAVIYAGLDAWMVVSAIHYGRQASDFKSAFENSTDISLRREYYDLYLDRKDERNKFTYLSGSILRIMRRSSFSVNDRSAQIGFSISPSLLPTILT